MKQVVVDTSILIEFLRVDDRPTIYEGILDKGFSPVVSFITVAELWAGKSVWEDEEVKHILTKLISGTTVVYPSFDLLQKAGQLRAEYGVSLLDCFIAALALEKNLPLVTLNDKDFKPIKGLKVV
jgi:predicted nucleic acid-binding protein